MILALLTAMAFADGPRPSLTIGARTPPLGAGLIGDLMWDVSDDASVGAGLGVYFYWYEPSAKFRAQVLDGFLVFGGSAGVEPGWFRGPDRDSTRRVFSVRPLGRASMELNLRNDLFWLYNRNTGYARYRTRGEYDPFRDQSFTEGAELGGEESFALMVSPSGAAERKVWLYGEVTLEGATQVGFVDKRLRTGVILEKLTPAISIDLDLSYSFMDTRVGGPGALFVLWWAPPRPEKETPDML